MPPPLPRRHLTGLQRLWLAFACVAALAVLLILGFYAEEDWRGARAFASVQAELRAKGETLDWRRFVPPPIPDGQNLAMSPLFVRELAYRTDPKSHHLAFGPPASRPDDLKDLPYGGPGPSLGRGGWDVAKPLDLPGLQQFYRSENGFPRADQPQSPAADVLLALTRYQPTLEELARGAVRPLSRFPVAWDCENPFSTALPHDNLVQQLVKTLQFRASARLAAGQAPDAARDVELAWRLCRDLRGEPNLIAHLVELTCLGITLTPLWEGLADRRWSADELTRLQGNLQRFNVLADYAATLRSERTFFLHGADYLKRHRDLPGLLVIMESPGTPAKPGWLARVAYAAVPDGWFDLNKACMAHWTQERLIKVIHPEADRFDLDGFNVGVRARELARADYTTYLTRLSLPIYESVCQRAVRMQAALDEAVAALALERFFLDHQAYPVRLAELVPAYLPRVPTDVIDGQPLRYRPTSDGRFQIYSVGLNNRDDGGTVAWTSASSLDWKNGDWVWQYAALAK